MRISLDPLKPCYVAPVDAAVSVEIGIDSYGRDWVKKIKFNTSEPMDESLHYNLMEAAERGSIYLHGGIDIVSDSVYRVVNDMLPQGTYTVHEEEDAISILIM